MVKMAKGLVWLVAYINVRFIRYRQLDGIGNGTLVAQLLEEHREIISLCQPGVEMEFCHFGLSDMMYSFHGQYV